MKVGVPREVKNNEYRVAITPAGVNELARHGHDVYIEREAGLGSAIRDEDFVAAGANILPTADDVWGTADLVLKVKEPIAEEYHRMRKDQVLFTYLHLAADKACTDALLAAGTTGIAYETVQLPDNSLPLLAPMSEVAGRLAPQVGSYHLMRQGGGRGPLMGGGPGVDVRSLRPHGRSNVFLHRHLERGHAGQTVRVSRRSLAHLAICSDASHGPRWTGVFHVAARTPLRSRWRRRTDRAQSRRLAALRQFGHRGAHILNSAV